MIPIYIKEDEQFIKVYEYIQNIFNQINQTCKDMQSNMEFSIDSKEFLKTLSLFGQLNIFKIIGRPVLGLEYSSSNKSWTVLMTDTAEQIKISLSDYTLYFSAKFNSLKNNFDGTFNSLKKSLENAFTLKKDYLRIKCNQNLVKDSEEVIHPALNIVVQLSTELNYKFPPLEAYTKGLDPWYIRNIDMEWVTASPENMEKYTFYKNFLELLTLFQNDYFKLNILGVLTVFEIDGNAPILRWGHSRWNESLWSNLEIEEKQQQEEE